MGSALTVIGDNLCSVPLLRVRAVSYTFHSKVTSFRVYTESRFPLHEARKCPGWHHTLSTVSWVLYLSTSPLVSCWKCMGSNKSKQWEVLNIVPALEHHYLFCVSIFLINETKIIAFELYSFCVINSMREYKMGKMFHM